MSDIQNKDISQQLAAMQQRLDLLERDNQRLRAKLEPMMGPDNPCFDPARFMLAFGWIHVPLVMLAIILPAILLPLLFVPGSPLSSLSAVRIGPVQLVSGGGNSVKGIGMGIVAVGGIAVGVIAIGGMSVGLIALGGGALGVIAIGGGAVGFIAIGGGAIGYIAIGGGACGYYALGQRARGKFALGLNRQDPEAIEFFVRWFPSLRAAVTTPMPVIPLEVPSVENQSGKIHAD